MATATRTVTAPARSKTNVIGTTSAGRSAPGQPGAGSPPDRPPEADQAVGRDRRSGCSAARTGSGSRSAPHCRRGCPAGRRRRRADSGSAVGPLGVGAGGRAADGLGCRPRRPRPPPRTTTRSATSVRTSTSASGSQPLVHHDHPQPGVRALRVPAAGHRVLDRDVTQRDVRRRPPRWSPSMVGSCSAVCACWPAAAAGEQDAAGGDQRGEDGPGPSGARRDERITATGLLSYGVSGRQRSGAARAVPAAGQVRRSADRRAGGEQQRDVHRGDHQHAEEGGPRARPAAEQRRPDAARHGHRDRARRRAGRAARAVPPRAPPRRPAAAPRRPPCCRPGRAAAAAPVRRCAGRPRCPAARSRSARRRRAAHPAATSQPTTGWPGSPAVMNAGSSPNETAYGSTESGVAFRRRLYAQAEATASRCREPASSPDSSDSGTTATAASDHRGPDAPPGPGRRRRPACPAAAAAHVPVPVQVVVHPADGQLPGEHRRRDRDRSGRPRARPRRRARPTPRSPPPSAPGGRRAPAPRTVSTADTVRAGPPVGWRRAASAHRTAAEGQRRQLDLQRAGGVVGRGSTRTHLAVAARPAPGPDRPAVRLPHPPPPGRRPRARRSARPAGPSPARPARPAAAGRCRSTSRNGTS